MEGLAQEAEKVAASSLRNQNGQSDKNGSVLMGADKQIKRWAEHFEELINRPAPQNQSDIQPAETDLPNRL